MAGIQNVFGDSDFRVLAADEAQLARSISSADLNSLPLEQQTKPIFQETSGLKRSWHQLVIIGNGFDLECGLPSSFSSFFSDRRRRLSATECAEADDSPDYSYTETVWDVILGDKSGSNWCNIEAAIADWVKPCEDHRGILKYDRIHDILYLFANPGSSHGTPRMRIAWPVAQYILNRYGNAAAKWKNRELLGFLRRELSVLEHDFDAYLSSEMNSSADYKDKAQKLIFALLAEERPDKRTHSITESVLSFNYTRPANSMGTPDHEISYVNIHGKLGGEIVFGIDGGGILSNPDIAQFTKTYRLMGLDLPDTATLVWDKTNAFNDDGTALIKFYGHSLGEPDYSYFQAIFDTVRLYEGNTRLVFYYRPHDDVDEVAARKDTMEQVMKLLSVYGETFDNKGHGNNLIHKLLLEGRLSVKLLPYNTIVSGGPRPDAATRVPTST